MKSKFSLPLWLVAMVAILIFGVYYMVRDDGICQEIYTWRNTRGGYQECIADKKGMGRLRWQPLKNLKVLTPKETPTVIGGTIFLCLPQKPVSRFDGASGVQLGPDELYYLGSTTVIGCSQ